MALSRDEQDVAFDKTLASLSQKGGVAKTTTTANLASGCARFGFRVLGVDMDPGRGLTALTGTDVRYDEPSVASLIRGNIDPRACVRPATQGWQPDTTVDWQRGGALRPGGRLDILPSPGNLLQQVGDENPNAAHLRLFKGLHESGLSADYDMVLIDCQPSPGHCTQMAILATGWVLFPVNPELLSTRGFADGVATVEQFATDWRHEIATAGVIITMANRTNEHEIGINDVIGWVDQHWPDSGFSQKDFRNKFASGVWTPVNSVSALVSAANGRGEPASSALSSLFTVSGQTKMGSRSQLRVAASYARHALNVVGLLAPESYGEVITQLHAEDMPDSFTSILFDPELRFTSETALEGATA